MNLRTRLRCLEKLKNRADGWSPEQWQEAHHARDRLQYLSLVVTRWLFLLGRDELPEPHEGVGKDAALVVEMFERRGQPLPRSLIPGKLAQAYELPEWLLWVWRFFPLPSTDQLKRWAALRAEDKGHLAPWWVGNLSEAEDPLPWPPIARLLGEYEQRVWQGRFPE